MELLPLYTAVAVGVLTLIGTILTLNSQAKKNFTENKLEFSRLQTELNDRIWARAKERLDDLEMIVEDEREKRRALEIVLNEERLERIRLDEKYERERRSFEERISALEKERDRLFQERDQLFRENEQLRFSRGEE